MFVGGGDNVVSGFNLDAKRVANCKYKKVKGVFEMMKALNASGCQQHVNTYNSGLTLSNQINQASFNRGQKILSKKSNNYFGNEDDDTNKSGLNRNALLGAF